MLFDKNSNSDDTAANFLARNDSSCGDLGFDAIKFLQNCATADSVFADDTLVAEVVKNKSTDFPSRLDNFYILIHEQLLVHQSPTSGLFPIFGSKDCNEGHVRDNIYCASCHMVIKVNS